MLDLIQRYNVGRRLGIAFSLMIVLTVALVSIGVASMSLARSELDNIARDNMQKIRLAQEMMDASSIFSGELRNLVLSTDSSQKAGFERIISEQRLRYDRSRKRLYGLKSDANGRNLQRKIDVRREASRGVNDQIISLAAAGQAQEALKVLLQESAPATQAWKDSIRGYEEFQNLRTQNAYEVAARQLEHGRNFLIAGGFAAILLSGLLAWFITNSLTIPLRFANKVADDIAMGKLDNDISSQGKDEPGRLLLSMQKMQMQLKEVLAAQAEMASRHEQGQISYRMDADSFPGEYGHMVRDSNQLAASHIAVKMRLVEVVGRYAVGDLQDNMDRLVGEKAVLTQTMDTAKLNLMSMNHEINRLTAAAASGNYKERGDEDRFQYDFRTMVVNLNRLMSTADSGLQALSNQFSALAGGDTDARVDGAFQGVFADMRDDANATAVQLSGIVSQIKYAAESITMAADEIVTGNQNLSQRTEQQAANLEEVAASMEELTSTVKQNAEHVRLANGLAIGAASVASEGGRIVSLVVDKMDGIEKSAKRIADIIGVIDGIAFQTNILALNAAVEAARAGEQGRGFAVVASEVRTLAQRASAAAKEIKDLIDDSVQRVTDGSLLVHDAGKTMTRSSPVCSTSLG